MFRLIFPSRYHRGRWLSAAAPILSDPRPEADRKAVAKKSEQSARHINEHFEKRSKSAPGSISMLPTFSKRGAYGDMDKHGTVEHFQCFDVHVLHRTGAIQETLVYPWVSLRMSRSGKC